MNVACEKVWRVFCAIELPLDLLDRLMTHINRVREAVPDARASWGRVDNIHLTLKFLGDISLPQVEKLSAAVSRSVKGVAPFTIAVEQTGVFPKHGPPRVLWVGISDVEGKIGELHTRVEDESAAQGFTKEDRPFNPHLTIARLRQPRHARTLAAAHKQLEFQAAEIAVSELLVIRSELSSDGSKYTVISRHPLGLSDKL